MPQNQQYRRSRVVVAKALDVRKIVANDRDLVSYYNDDDKRVATSSADDMVKIDGLTLTIESGGVDRYSFSTDLIEEVTDADGTRQFYTPLSSPTPTEQEERLEEVFGHLADNIFKGCCCGQVSGGGGECVAIPILDDSDVQIAVVAQDENVKLMDDGATATLNSGTWEIECPTPSPRIMPRPISFDPADWASSDPNDYDAIYSDLVDFYEFDFDHRNIQMGANNYVLDALTPNPFGGVARYTSTDGTPSDYTSMSTKLAFPSGYGAGIQYIVCDWKHRIMIYQPNLGNMALSGFLADIASKNSSGFQTYNDWKGMTLDVYEKSARPDKGADINTAGVNALLDGIVSSYNPGANARNLTIERWAQSTSSVWIHFASTGNQVTQGDGYLTNTTGYIWRYITDADITAMGGTP